MAPAWRTKGRGNRGGGKRDVVGGCWEGEKHELYCPLCRISRSREAPGIPITKRTKSVPKATVRGDTVGSRGLAGCGA